MADQIFADGPIDAPAVYEVPGSSEIIPVAVQAVLNGSAASGDYVPTLIFRSQAGHVIARVPTATTVTAGDDAEVSWFPGVKPTTASTPTTLAQLKWCRVVADGGPAVADLSIVSLDTNDPTNYYTESATNWHVPAVPQNLAGFFLNESGFVALNGDWEGRLYSGSGFILTANAPNGFKSAQFYFAQGLYTLAEYGSSWHAQVLRADTHLWAVHAWFSYVG